MSGLRLPPPGGASAGHADPRTLPQPASWSTAFVHGPTPSPHVPDPGSHSGEWPIPGTAVDTGLTGMPSRAVIEGHLASADFCQSSA